MREITRQARGRGQQIGLVPTMGYLHEGHLELVRAIKLHCELVVMSIFVNPTQFGEGEDFDSYPRDLTRDADLCIAEGVNYLFVPEAPDMYPNGFGTWIEVTDLSERWEGASRPGHFRGVATVVTKLLEVVRPSVVAFGEKDAQQLAVVRRVVDDLMLDVEILAVPIVREEDGLALSSRNVKLSSGGRAAAPAIYRALRAARSAIEEQAVTPEEALGIARSGIEAETVLEVDYLALVDPKDFTPVTEARGEARLLAAVKVDGIRLLDNLGVRWPAESQ